MTGPKFSGCAHAAQNCRLPKIRRILTKHHNSRARMASCHAGAFLGREKNHGLCPWYQKGCFYLSLHDTFPLFLFSPDRREVAYICFSSVWMKASGGMTPTRRSTSSPPLKKMTVGMPLTW